MPGNGLGILRTSTGLAVCSCPQDRHCRRTLQARHTRTLPALAQQPMPIDCQYVMLGRCSLDFSSLQATMVSSVADGGVAMTFEEVLAQIIEVLQRDKRISYRALKRRFALDDVYLDDLKEEIIYAKRLALDEDSRVLVWTGDAEAPLLPALPASPPVPPHMPLAAHATQTDGPPTPPQ